MASAAEQALANAPAIENPELNYKFVDLGIPFKNAKYQAAMDAGVMPNVLVDGKVMSKVAAVALEQE